MISNPTEATTGVLDILEGNRIFLKCHTVRFTCFKFGGDAEAWLRLVQKNCDWVLGQLEKCPTTNRLHIQGMAWQKGNNSWGFLKCDTRKCDYPIQCIEYCSKSRTKVEGPWEFGIRPTWNVKGAKRARVSNKTLLETPLTQLIEEEKVSLRGSKKLMEDINNYKVMKETEPLPKEENQWIYGPPGVGKSHYVRDQSDDLFTKAQNKWWDGYSGQKDVLIDDFDHGGTVLSHYLKIWGDKYPFSAEIKGGTIRPNIRRIFITSNYTPRELWGDKPGGSELVDAIERRFIVYWMGQRGVLRSAADL